MDREPDSHAQLSAGSKKERLTPGQRDMARERRRGDRKIESSFQIAAGLAVCTHRAFRVKVNPSFKSGTLFFLALIASHNGLVAPQIHRAG